MPADNRLFKKGEIVAIRGVDDDFFLARLLQHVFKDLENAKVWWLEEEPASSSTATAGSGGMLFRFGGIQSIPTESIMTPVKLTKVDKRLYELPTKEKEEIVDTLDRSIMGRGWSDDEEDEDESGVEEDEEDEDEGVVVNARGTKRKPKKQAGPDKRKKPASPAKKKALSPKKEAASPKKKAASPKKKAASPKKKAASPQRKPATGGKGKKTPKAPKAPKAPKEKKKAVKKVKVPKEKKPRKGVLVVRDNVKVLEKDPFFFATTTHPYVSANVAAKLVFRAMNLGDNALLKKIVKNVQQVPALYASIQQSVNVEETVVEQAFRMRNVEAVKILQDQKKADEEEPKTPNAKKVERVESTSCQLQTQSTGRYNFKSLGHAVRNIELSRGSREGNNALIKDVSSWSTGNSCSKDNLNESASLPLANSDASWEDIKKFSTILGGLHYLEIDKFVERGNYQVIFHLSDMKINSGGFGYSKLFRDVLAYPGCYKASLLTETRKTVIKPGEDPVLGDKAVLRHASVVKKEFESNRGMTPLHFACLNANSDYLEKLLTITPDVNLMDKRRKRLLHYAAVSPSPACVKLLLARGASLDEVDSGGQTPMICAAIAGRHANVKTMYDFAVAKNQPITRFGVAGINRGDRFSNAPIHVAVIGGHLRVVEALLECGADVEKPLSASKNKVTPLMLACQRGNMEMVKLLHAKGAKLDGRDKLKRSPLMHAVIDGQTAVASYLLHAGVSIDHVDSSGNSALLYAVAYGWYFCVKSLIEVGADINLANSWKIPPLGIAFLKGHLGLFEYLLDASKEVDINFKDLEGSTLVMSVLKGEDAPLALKQLEYLIKEKKADCSLLDVKGNGPLHYLCCNSGIVGKDEIAVAKLKEKGQIVTSFVERAALLLIENGCKVDLLNEDGVSPLTLAAENGNVVLMQVLMDHGAALIAEDAEEKDGVENILHSFAQFADNRKFLDFMTGFFADPKNAKAISKLKVLAGKTNQNGKNVLNLVMAKICDVANRTPGHYTKLESLVERRLVSLAYFDLLVQHLQPDVNQKPTITRSGVKRDGDSLLHMVCKLGRENSGYVLQVLDRILKMKADIHALSYEQSDLGRTPLVYAVRNGTGFIGKALLDAGADPNFQTAHKPGFLALNQAVFMNHLPLALLLLDHGADINKLDAASGEYALHIALNKSNPNMEMIQLLLNRKANVNCLNHRLRSPLHLAINYTRGHTDESTEAIEALIAAGADLFAVDSRGRLPLHYCFVKIQGAGESKAFDPIEICTLLTSAMKYNSLDVPDTYRSTPLYYAAQRGAVVCCMHLIKRNCAVNVVNDEGNTPLSVSVRNGHRNCVLNLLQSGANVDITIYPYEKRPDEKEAAKIAEEKRLKEASKEIEMKWLPSVSESLPEPKGTHVFVHLMKNNWQGELYLMLDLLDKWGLSFGDVVGFAIKCGQLQVALRILRKCVDPKVLTKIDSQGRTLLHIFALHVVCGGCVDNTQSGVVDKLLDAGVDPLAVDVHGCTLFHYCSYNHGFGLAKHILHKMNDLEAKRRVFQMRSKVMQQTPLTSLIWNIGGKADNGQLDKCTEDRVFSWIKDCVDFGADVDAVAWFPLIQPTFFGEAASCFRDLRQFTEGAALDSKAPRTLLHVAVELRLFNLVKRLLAAAGADVNKAEPEEGVTPLMAAIRANQTEIVNVILNHDYTKEKKDPEKAKVEEDEEESEEEEEDDEDEDREDDEEQEEEEQEEEEPMDDDDEEKEKEKEGEEIDENQNEDVMMEDEEQEGENEEEKMEDDAEGEDGDGDEDDDDNGQKDGELTSKSLFTRQTEKEKEEDKKEEEKPKKKRPSIVKKTSCVDLNAASNNGRTAAHFCVAPLDGATFNNVAILKTLHRNGMEIDESVIELAASAQHGNQQMLDTLLALKGVKKLADGTKSAKAVYSSLPEQLPSLREGQEDRVDYQTDSRAFLDTLLESRTSAPTTVPVDIVALPRDEQPLSAVAIEDGTNIPYDFIGSKVDVGYGGPFGYGLFNYYKMQVIHQAGKDLYLLTTRWGRFGDSGKFQRTPFENKEAAVAEFKKIFKAKTKNEWDNAKENSFAAFVNHPGKYRLFINDHKPKPMFKSAQFQFESTKDSPLPDSRIADPRILKMLKDLTKTDVLMTALRQLTNARDDQALLALGDTQKNNLQEAMNILQQVEEVLKEREKHGDYSSEESGGKEANEKSAEKLFHLSNELFHLVPLKEVDESTLKPFQGLNEVTEKRGLLKQILDIHASALMLAASQRSLDSVHPFDYLYRAIDCKVAPLEEQSREAQFVLRYITASCKNTKIHGIYALERPGELQRVVSTGIDNHRLLFHGTGKENLLSILSRGLLIAPPEAAICGHAFGKGVYFADQFNKSKNYARGGNGPSYMFICQVALGKSDYETRGNCFNRPLAECQSRKVAGTAEPNPVDDLTLCTPGAPVMPLGGLVQAPKEDNRRRWYDPSESEYLIFDENQIALRYLIRFS